MLSFLQSSKAAPSLFAEKVPERAPEKTSVEPIALADIESPEVATIVAAWNKWRGMHAMPAREKLSLRDFGRAASHISLARALNEGEDYEFRIIGDAHVRAYGTSYQNKSLKDVIIASPRFGKQLKASYDLVRNTGRAYSFRGLIGRDAPDAAFAWFETCYLPFEINGIVDHILNAAVYAPRRDVFA
jgi:hypothetical protein